MITDFWRWLNKYPSVNSLQKLNSLKQKYLTSESNIKYLHITGTNGKGSVARYLQAILNHGLKFKVGLFTSPHINSINERIMINDQMISDEDLLIIKDLIINDVEKNQLGFFAILTLIALIYFQEQAVQWAVIEVGIGGLFDATNIISSDYAVLTSVANDHNQLLGPNLLAILKQKLGIIKTTTKNFFVSGNVSEKLKNYINKTININTYFSQKCVNKSYFYQNQTLVLLVINILFPNFENTEIWKIINNTEIRLRFQVINFFDKKIYFDSAHNLAAINDLIKVLKLKKIVVNQIIFSALTTKKPDFLIKKLTKKLTNNIIICQNNHPLSIKAQKFNFAKMIFEVQKNSTILVTGSCYFTALVYQELLMKNKELGK